MIERVVKCYFGACSPASMWLRIHSMAKTNDKPKRGRGRPEKLVKGSDGYYETIGGLGGNATLKNRGKAYFSRLAKLSHLRRGSKSKTAPAQEKSSSS
jgi:hypothetical protein